MLHVSNVNFDTKRKIITKQDTYNLGGNRTLKVEEMQTRDLGKFIKVTELENGRKIRTSIKRLDKDTYEKVQESKQLWDLFFKCDED